MELDARVSGGWEQGRGVITVCRGDSTVNVS